MKQYVDYYGKGTKKVPLPVAFHLEQAVGALTLHTGRNYMISHGHKKCPQQIISEPTRLSQMVNAAKVNIIFGLAKQKRNFFRVPLKNLLSNN